MALLDKSVLEILLIEDNEIDALLLKRKLKKIELFGSYTVEVSACLKEALEAIKTSNYDLMISDMGLPDGAGTEIIIALRQVNTTTPILVLSGDERPATKSDSLALGASCFLQKNDLSVETLRHEIKRIASQ